MNTLDSTNPKKPVFLSKAQREELAVKLRQEEISEQRRRREQPVPSTPECKEVNVDRNRDRDRKRYRDRDRDRRERDRKPERRIRDRVEKLVEREREKKIDAIKEQYLGVTKQTKKRMIKPSEKFRFSFDLENTEDSSSDTNPLYQNPHEAQLLFGRGFRAGIDRREQKKHSANNEIDKLWSEKRLEEMSERDWRIFKEDFNISYKGSKIPHPMRNWKESNKLSSELLEAVDRANYKKPTSIQMAAIPLGLEQRDVIGIAETGSGKTIAFVLPMLSKLPRMNEKNNTEGPYALVMVPTRELALQIEKETVKFARYLEFKVTSIVGGQSIEKQGFKITQGCEILIATPGRLIDCLERRYVVLNQCNYVVLDEADRMIDLGFEPQVAAVLDAMPKPEEEKNIYRTTYMFSATMASGVERLARKYLRNPVVVTVGKNNTDLISQHVIMTKESDKFFRLKNLWNINL